MHDPVHHVFVDTNLLSAFFHPQSTGNAVIRERSRILLTAALVARWPGIKLYTPAICIAETLHVLDKYRFCKWQKPMRDDHSRRLSPTAYQESRTLLMEAVRTRQIEQLQHEPAHIFLASLISPVNTRYQIRRKHPNHPSKIKPPMSAADCLIVGMAIHLAKQLGRSSVIMATADQRLTDVVGKARKLRYKAAELLGLVSTAEQNGLKWSEGLYPPCIDLHKASDKSLRKAFGGWPLPTTLLVPRTRKQLSLLEVDTLANAWIAVASDHEITNPDRLAYNPALEDLRIRFAVSSNVLLSSQDAFLHLLGLRKAKKLPRVKPPQTSTASDRQRPLFDMQ